METLAQAQARLAGLRGEFMALRKLQNRDRMSGGDVARAGELRDEISVLKAHVARLETFEALVARGRQQRTIERQ
jgi:hypothetical protein